MSIPKKVASLLDQIKEIKSDITLMEVCGTHTMNIAKFGLRSLFPKNIKIISGPGCPVCVSSSNDIYKAIELSNMEDVIIASFGDMLRVPCLNDALINHKNVKIIYSPLDAIKLAKDNPNKKIVLFGVGFETTTPTIASTIISADLLNLKNFFVLCVHKIVPPALELIVDNKKTNIDGFILPGHVSVITGSSYFDFLSNKGQKGVVTGFDPINIIDSICKLVLMVEENKNIVVNNYGAVVSGDGNKKAQSMVCDVFDICDSEWRGIGLIKNSGLQISNKYSKFDAEKNFKIKTKQIDDPAGCLCGQVLMGISNPTDCFHYGKTCTPSTPVGPCMVSSEGTCAAYYKYIKE